MVARVLGAIWASSADPVRRGYRAGGVRYGAGCADLRRDTFDQISQQCGPATLPPQPGTYRRFPDTDLRLQPLGFVLGSNARVKSP